MIVSAGQDILSDDPLGGMNLLPEDLGVLTSLLLGAGCPLSFVLEGGYGPSHGLALSHIFSALEHPEEPTLRGTPGAGSRQLADLLRKVHRLP